MHSLPSPAKRPLYLKPSLTLCSPLHSRPLSLRLVSSSIPSILRKFQSHHLTSRKPKYAQLLARNCSSITFNSSSELRRNITRESVPDEKLCALRELFSKPEIDIDAYIIPSQDAHQSEFIAECYMRRAYVSGFTGSAGIAAVTKDKAALWTDGRYFLQAEKQLSWSWILMKDGNSGVPTTSEWLNNVLTPGSRVGIDPFLFSFDAAEELKESISKKNLELVYLYNLNLVDEIWKKSRPKPPNKPIRVHDLRYAGLDVASKLSTVRTELFLAGSSAIIISMLDEVCWLLNLRGGDVPHSPVMYAYLIVQIDRAKLFVDNYKVTPEVMNHLTGADIELKPYDSILSEIESLGGQGAQLWLDPSSVNAAIIDTYKSAFDRYLSSLGHGSKTFNDSSGQSWAPMGVYKTSPISLAKAIKNPAEVEGMRNSHLSPWTQILFGKVQSKGYGANGAVIHYKPEPDTCIVVGKDKLFLLDSGAQYVDGTTDITRTVHFGEPTARQKECFTLVLQGHIALDQAIFPENTPGFVLDAFARSFLWKIGLDYRHGTGHGVGAALHVHEGPQSISPRFGNMTALEKGMIVSNEPGYYEDYAFGIRIENLLYVKEVDTPNRFGGIGYLGFEKLTFFPIQTKLVDSALLSDAEIDWLNDYHSQVWDKVSPFLDGAASQWLWNYTRPLTRH